MAQPIFCAGCGAEQQPSNLFCPRCGRRLAPKGGSGVTAESGSETGRSGNTPSATPSFISEEMWLRLKAEEEEYSRRSQRKARVGCLILSLLLIAGAVAIWLWVPSKR